MTRDQFESHPLIHDLLSLRLDPDDFVVFGSGPLLVHGIRDVEDLDIVARGSAWKRVQETGTPAIGPLNDAPMIQFWDGKLEFSNGWITAEWSVDELIDRADLVYGIRFACIADVLRYKRNSTRPKDIEDAKALERHVCKASDHEAVVKQEPR